MSKKPFRKLTAMLAAITVLLLPLSRALAAEGDFFDSVASINNSVSNILWGPPMLILLVGAGIFLSFRLKFFQFSKIGTWFRFSLGSLGKDKSAEDKQKDHGAVSSFGALCTALAATIGVGNIAGVATAIVSGGPGAVFWMWISALFGMVTKYSEIVLSLNYRQRGTKGEWLGGPMYYLEKGLKCKWLSVLFCIFAILASFGIGNMSQANTISNSMLSTFGIPTWITGVVVALLVGAIILGGLKRITKITTFIVPFMAIFYIVGGLIIIIVNADQIGGVFSSIFENAFGIKAVGGGVLGYTVMQAMRFGVGRGVFSNEAGLGSAPIVHAAADVDHPVKQGCWGVFEVFADTIIVCTISALVILSSGVFGQIDPATGKMLTGASLTSAAFASALPGVGQYIVTIAILFFALSTMLGWSYYGERALGYLCRESSGGSHVYSYVYKVIFIAAILLGAMLNINLVWDISDNFNALMAIPNLVGVIGLSGVVVKLTKDFIKKQRDLRARSASASAK